MNLRRPFPWAVLALALVASAVVVAARPAGRSDDPVARGRYLVESFGCADCHSPWVPGPAGPEPDRTRHLSGHPADVVMPPAPELPAGPWVMVVGETNTAWHGPWGTSFTANLTPDVDTGLGSWTEDEFVRTLRTGRRLGRGRELLPPMPWQMYRNLTDEDLRAIFAYLRSLPVVPNRVPDPLPPTGGE